LKISCVTGIYREKDLKEALELISEAGYKNVEIAGWPYQNWGYTEVGDKELKIVKKKIEDLGLQVSAVCAFLKSPPEQVVEIAQFLGASVVIAGPSVRKGESLEPAKKWIEDLEPLLDKTDVKFGIENHYGYFFEDINDGLQIMELTKSRKIGLNLDTGHFQWSGVNIIDVAKKLAEHAVNVHVKDVVFADGKKRLDLEEFKQRKMTALGRGKIDLAGFIAEMKRRGYDGYYSVEIERVSDLPTATRQEWLKESRKYLEGLLKC